MLLHGDLLGERARLTPDKTALVYVPTGERLTYAELDARAVRWARLWRETLGLRKGDRVAVLCDNRPELVEIFFAAPKSGIVVVPLGTRLTPKELAGILEDAAPAAFVYGAEHSGTAAELRGMVAIPHWAGLDVGGDGTIPDLAASIPDGRTPIPDGRTPIPKGMGAIPDGMKAIPDGMTPIPDGMAPIPEGMAFVPDGMALIPEGMAFVPDGMAPIPEGMASIPSGMAPLPEGMEPRPEGTPEDLWCLLYTSGTTGRPKGVMLPYRMIVWNGYNTAVGWQLREDDVTSIFTPLYHAGGLGAFLVPIVTIGGMVVLHRGFDAAEVWRTIEAEGVTVALGVPTIFQMLAEAPAFETVDLSRVRWLISGGAPLPSWIIDTYQSRGVAFKQGYGLTEVGVNCFAMTVDESVSHPGSIGKPLMFTETRLVDEDGKTVAIGEVGELLLRGPHVCRGYWNNPEATAAALDADGWFHTGDLARRDGQGFHWIAGRRKDMIISGGVNVYPAEIEGELVLHPGVRDAAVVGVPHATWGEMGVAFVIAGSEPPTAEDLTAFLAGRLAKYKIPRKIRFVESLPRTPYGKVVKGELREAYLAETAARTGS